METPVGSRLSLLSGEAIDFCPSENRIDSSSDTERCFTAVFNSKDCQRRLSSFTDQNKTPTNKDYITLNGDKEKSFINGNKEKIGTSHFSDKFVENDNSYITFNGNKEKPSFNANKGKILSSNCNEKVKDENSYITLNGNKEKPFNANKGKILISNCNERVKDENSYITVNGNKEKSLVNGNKERVVEDGMPIPKQIIYTGKIQVNWKNTRKIGAGLENMGNTCFLNTVIQCLTYCPPLANHLLHDNPHSSSKCNGNGFCMMCLLQKHIKKAFDGKTSHFRPQEVYYKLKSIAKHFQHGRQEDAHEFLRFVIDNLWRSCLQSYTHSKLDSASKETTIINQIFGGYHRSQVTCSKCKEQSNTFDHFMDFILDIKQNVETLEEALKKFVAPEVLENDNAYKCPKCKVKVQAWKKFSVYKAPNVATFQLKRFDYNRSFGGKITRHISYPTKLNLRPYMSQIEGEAVYYHLNAVLVHSGPTCNSGHYYCYVKNSDGRWYLMDDQRVICVSVNQVLAQNAYVLFYVKSIPTECFPSKKPYENGIAHKKIDSPVCKKLDDVPASKPLIQNNQFKYSSPKPKLQEYPAFNLNKRNGLSPNVNSREKVMFAVHNQSAKSQELKISTPPPPSNKIQLHVNTPKTESHQSGLVPYIEDSSDSSDGDDIVKLNSGSNSRVGAPNSLGSAGYKPECFNGFNIKRKSYDIPASHASRLSNSSSSTSPKVTATGVWSVTDRCTDSPGADSNSSVQLTNDWHVTSTDSEEVTIKKNDSEEKYSQNGNGVLNHNGLDDSTKQRDFRKQEDRFGHAFFAKEGSSEKSSLKRKCSDSDTEYSANSKFCNGENQSSFVPKKVKCESDFVNSNGPLPKKIKVESGITKADSVNNSDSSNKLPKFPKTMYSSESASLTAVSPHKSYGSSPYKSPKKTDINSQGNGKLEKSDVSKNNGNCSNSSNSSFEYEWVEKTTDNFRHSFKGNQNYGRDEKSHFRNLNDKNGGQKFDVVKELNNNSKHFYGPNVHTWNGKNHYKDVDNKHKKSFENYEDEYDQGKVRKHKSYNGFNKNYRGRNSFQDFINHSYGNKHKDQYYNNDRGRYHNRGQYRNNRGQYHNNRGQHYKDKMNTGGSRWQNHRFSNSGKRF